MLVLAFFVYILAKNVYREGHNKSGFPLRRIGEE